MKKLKIISTILCALLSCNSFAETYLCGAHRSPQLECGGYSYPELLAPREIQTSLLRVGESMGMYSAMALPISDINSPCEDPGQNLKIPGYLFEVSKTSDNQLMITVFESVFEKGSFSTFMRHIYSAPIGSATLATPVFRDSVIGQVSLRYECNRVK